MSADIVLVRHGPVDCLASRLQSRAKFAAWVESYRTSSLQALNFPPLELSDIARQCVAFFSSELRRARDSAALLAGKTEIVADSIFNEVELNIPDLPIILPNAAWLALSRLGGRSEKGLTARNAQQQRSELAAVRLEGASENGPVMLVGHGWVNFIIGRVLKERGYSLVYDGGTNYWAYRVYRPAGAVVG
jgi:broad specificity phosphatase PhoE